MEAEWDIVYPLLECFKLLLLVIPYVSDNLAPFKKNFLIYSHFHIPFIGKHICYKLRYAFLPRDRPICFLEGLERVLRIPNTRAYEINPEIPVFYLSEGLDDDVSCDGLNCDWRDEFEVERDAKRGRLSGGGLGYRGGELEEPAVDGVVIEGRFGQHKFNGLLG